MAGFCKTRDTKDRKIFPKIHTENIFRYDVPISPIFLFCVFFSSTCLKVNLIKSIISQVICEKIMIT